MRYLQSSSVHIHKAVKSTATKQIQKKLCKVATGIALYKKAGQQKQELCIKSKEEAHKNVRVLELYIHKKEVAEVGQDGPL